VKKKVKKVFGKDVSGRIIITDEYDWQRHVDYIHFNPVKQLYSRNESLDIRVGNIAIRELLNPNYKALTYALANPNKKIEAPGRRILPKIIGESGWVNK
jgi:hypothetical protein